jgi:hypothetical protein
MKTQPGAMSEDICIDNRLISGKNGFGSKIENHYNENYYIKNYKFENYIKNYNGYNNDIIKYDYINKKIEKCYIDKYDSNRKKCGIVEKKENEIEPENDFEDGLGHVFKRSWTRYADGHVEIRYYRNNSLHRLGRPAVEIIDKSGKVTKRQYWRGGCLHRRGAPAVLKPDIAEWWECGSKIREEKPWKDFLELDKYDSSYHLYKNRCPIYPVHVIDGAAVIHYMMPDGTEEEHRVHPLTGEFFATVDWQDRHKWTRRVTDKGYIIRTEWHSDGYLSRDGNPAVIATDALEFWLDGKMCRRIEVDTSKLACSGHYHTLTHRENIWEIRFAPYEYDEGTLDMIGSPARIFPDGTKEYFLDGILHNANGPARILPDGTNEWYYKGEFLFRWTPPVPKTPTPKTPEKLGRKWYYHDELVMAVIVQ